MQKKNSGFQMCWWMLRISKSADITVEVRPFELKWLLKKEADRRIGLDGLKIQQDDSDARPQSGFGPCVNFVWSFPVP